jgi:hypothetical protein
MQAHHARAALLHTVLMMMQHQAALNPVVSISSE